MQSASHLMVFFNENNKDFVMQPNSGGSKVKGEQTPSPTPSTFDFLNLEQPNDEGDTHNQGGDNSTGVVANLDDENARNYAEGAERSPRVVVDDGRGVIGPEDLDLSNDDEDDENIEQENNEHRHSDSEFQPTVEHHPNVQPSRNKLNKKPYTYLQRVINFVYVSGSTILSERMFAHMENTQEDIGVVGGVVGFSIALASLMCFNKCCAEPMSEFLIECVVKCIPETVSECADLLRCRNQH